MRPPVGSGFEQDRVHRRLGRDTGGLRLQVLRPADLAPSAQTTELFDMFCALNGATEIPRRASARQIPVTSSDLPASEDVPATRIPLADLWVLATG